jgi:hypothetical protein
MAAAPALRHSLQPLARRVGTAALVGLLGLLGDVPEPLDAQTGAGAVSVPDIMQNTSPYPPLVPGMAPVPFTVGEKLEYDVRFSFKSVGRGTMEVKELTDVRGRPSWHTIFTIRGGIPFFRVDDVMESWFDVFSLSTRRFHQRISEGGYKRTREYEMFPERSVFTQNGGEEEPSVPNPLDDGSFLYFVRTLPLEVGRTYDVPRYFNPKGNPVRIRVLRRDTIRVPAGEFATVVLQPTFQSRGLFSEDGRAEVWITDDAHRFMVQMKSSLKIGSINLFLRQYTLPPTARGASSPR